MRHNETTTEVMEVVDIVATADGSIVGRTRLQKTACLLTMAGLSDEFDFIYKHFGPFSQELANATEVATLFSNLEEEQRSTQWGGSYSIFKTKSPSQTPVGSVREKIIKIANAADTVELELATTAAFLAKQGFKDVWDETERRKPEKAANGRIERAKVLYSKFKILNTPKKLPQI